MRRFSLVLDALPALREAMGAGDCGLVAAAELAQLAGVDALRLSVCEALLPIREVDIRQLRAVARRLELRMFAHPSLLELALEARPDRVVLGAPGREGPGAGGPIDLRGRHADATPLLRSLEEAGIEVACRVSPVLDAVKAAHGEGAGGVEFTTRAILDLPLRERRAQLTCLADASRLAGKLGLEIGIAGGLHYHNVSEVLLAAPECRRVVAGGALVSRSLLVGIDRAVRDFRALLT